MQTGGQSWTIKFTLFKQKNMKIWCYKCNMYIMYGACVNAFQPKMFFKKGGKSTWSLPKTRVHLGHEAGRWLWNWRRGLPFFWTWNYHNKVALEKVWLEGLEVEKMSTLEVEKMSMLTWKLKALDARIAGRRRRQASSWSRFHETVSAVIYGQILILVKFKLVTLAFWGFIIP
jgi:hypothetical protein